MKKYLLVLPLMLFFVSCDKKSKIEKAVAEIPVEIQVDRFDKAFFESEPQDLSRLKKQYPFFFPRGNDDAVWINKMQDPLWKELYKEVQKKYPDFQPQKAEIESLLKHIKYYFPETNTTKVITVVSEMDYNNKVIYADSLIVVALELYLGKDHPFYASEFPEYIRQNFDEKQMMPDIVSAFAVRKIVPPTDNTLLGKMIYAGKELYLKEVLLPDYNDADKMGYKPDQIDWCEENESYMWRYFIENSLLYDSDQKLVSRFINKAPFSKFYLEIDNESPGRVGAWIGWQIVRSYTKNNEVSLQQLLQTDAREIFEKSKYKPKKNE